jgi:hypothetical protein
MVTEIFKMAIISIAISWLMALFSLQHSERTCYVHLKCIGLHGVITLKNTISASYAFISQSVFHNHIKQFSKLFVDVPFFLRGSQINALKNFLN